LAYRIYHLPSFGGVLTLESHFKAHSNCKGIVDSFDILVQANDKLAGPEKHLAFQNCKKFLMIKTQKSPFFNQPRNHTLVCNTQQTSSVLKPREKRLQGLPDAYSD
jgi:hypothetical protein